MLCHKTFITWVPGLIERVERAEADEKHEMAYRYHCRGCGYDFDEPGWDCDGNYCPRCQSTDLIDREKEC